MDTKLITLASRTCAVRNDLEPDGQRDCRCCPSPVWYKALQSSWRAPLVTAVSVVACVAFGVAVLQAAEEGKTSISDLSAVVTGIILAMNAPVGTPIGQLIGDLVAIIVVKQLFGGIGMNLANPCTGRSYRAVHQLCLSHEQLRSL